uniref:hypothetical protein n=1 Tax=Okeania sp. SIO2F4 TaxID=2607790 RepID=UPI0025EA08F4
GGFEGDAQNQRSNVSFLFNFSSDHWLNCLLQTFFQDALILSAVQYLQNFGKTRKNLVIPV